MNGTELEQHWQGLEGMDVMSMAMTKAQLKGLLGDRDNTLLAFGNYTR